MFQLDTVVTQLTITKGIQQLTLRASIGFSTLLNTQVEYSNISCNSDGPINIVNTCSMKSDTNYTSHFCVKYVVSTTI